ncbi:hypothetical protein PHET_05454 [Paragonimus heterotremus]|uniref:Uncharacterized protein n=1 Tax=Paragonimus heterotremus TaxID=100268 RepID=A0A8J4WRG8_9TREM|nr:hypothetical protein PHET_05454 [Paragonimus heterotremus]
MGCCRTISYTMFLILGAVVCFPEESFLKSHVAKNSSFAIQKSMANNSEVYVKYETPTKCSIVFGGL